MKKSFYLAAAAALLMATSSAHAGSGFSFEIGGQKVHIDAPKNCSSLSCLSVTNNGSAINLKNLNLKGKSSDDDDVATNSPPPAPQPPAPPAVQAPPPAPAPVANIAPPAPPAPVENNAPVADPPHERLSGLPAMTNDNPPRAANTAPAYTAPANPTPVANNPPPAPPAAPVAAPPAVAANSPLGLWATEDNKGNVRIEQCGANLCGYAEHTNERILINMKPADNKWVGRIHDPDSNSNYDSTIALKGPNLLKVQGCAFGGLFCGGQTWKRIS